MVPAVTVDDDEKTQGRADSQDDEVVVVFRMIRVIKQ
jgi:hypothetical protein